VRDLPVSSGADGFGDRTTPERADIAALGDSYRYRFNVHAAGLQLSLVVFKCSVARRIWRNRTALTDRFSNGLVGSKVTFSRS
jgi:hypothetical protein